MEDIVDCTEQEKIERLNFCKNCPAFKIKEDLMTECADCNCSISYMITFKFKICPRGNWE